MRLKPIEGFWLPYKYLISLQSLWTNILLVSYLKVLSSEKRQKILKRFLEQRKQVFLLPHTGRHRIRTMSKRMSFSSFSRRFDRGHCSRLDWGKNRGTVVGRAAGFMVERPRHLRPRPTLGMPPVPVLLQYRTLSAMHIYILKLELFLNHHWFNRFKYPVIY